MPVPVSLRRCQLICMVHGSELFEAHVGTRQSGLYLLQTCTTQVGAIFSPQSVQSFSAKVGYVVLFIVLGLYSSILIHTGLQLPRGHRAFFDACGNIAFCATPGAPCMLVSCNKYGVESCHKSLIMKHLTVSSRAWHWSANDEQ